MCLIMPILFPIATVIFIGLIILYFILLGGALGYMNEKVFQSSGIYQTVKPIIAILFIFLFYGGFSLLTDSFFYENSRVICTMDSDYYHWDMNCYYLPDDYAPIEEEESGVLSAMISGRKPCNECVDYYSDLKSIRNSFIAFGVLYSLIILAEYLYKNGLIPPFVYKLLDKIGLKWNWLYYENLSIWYLQPI